MTKAAPRSLWLNEALAIEGQEESPRLEGDERADVCIVGGGYTGLWTAIRLKEIEPSLDVAIVEADICGGGASGRNGGFVLSWWSKYTSLTKLCGPDEALRLAQASANAVHEIGEFCTTNGIDARFHEDGYLWAATNKSQLGSWQDAIGELDRKSLHPFTELTQQELLARTGSPDHLGGVLEASGAIVQPALLARGLRRVAMGKGVRIFERSPMTSIDGRVRTPPAPSLPTGSSSR